MNGRELYDMFCSACGGETGARPTVAFDYLSTGQKLTWTRLADDVVEDVMNDLRERGIMWEPTS